MVRWYGRWSTQGEFFMPDTPSGTAGNEPNPAAAAGQPGAASGQGGSGASGTQPDAERQQQDQGLTAEAAKWRTSFRDAEKTIGTLKQELEDLKTKVNASPGGDQSASASEIATLKRTIADLQQKQKTADERAQSVEQKARTKSIQATLSGIVSEGRVVDPTAAKRLLESYATVDDDDVVVFTVKEKDGSERKVPASLEAVREHKLLSDIFFPAEGSSGSGSRGGARSSVNSGVDMERAKRDPDYYQANRDKIHAELKARTSAR
jgi:hypothetical protein